MSVYIRHRIIRDYIEHHDSEKTHKNLIGYYNDLRSITRQDWLKACSLISQLYACTKKYGKETEVWYAVH